MSICSPHEYEVETVARAMFDAQQRAKGLPASEPGWRVTREDWVVCARAAIAALDKVRREGVP